MTFPEADSRVRGNTLSVEVAYGVQWRDADGVQEGRLTVGTHALHLVPLTGKRTPLRELPFDAIRGIEIKTTSGPAARPVLVFDSPQQGTVEIESGVGKWLLAELLAKTLEHVLARKGGVHRLLVAVKVAPGSRDRAIELLKAGPPFDPVAIPITRHDVFLIDDEVLFLFETDDRLALEQAIPDTWRWAQAWRDLVVEVREARCVYSWARTNSPRPPEPAGLGY